jgi:hypothetical protein
MDGAESAPTPAIEHHWSECATCREQHAAMLRLLEGVRQLPVAALDPGFAHTMTQRVLRDRRQRQVKMRRRVLVTMALAASILFLLLVGYGMMPPTPADNPPPLVQTGQPGNNPVPPPPAESKRPRKHEPRNAIASLSERWAGTTRDHAAVVIVAAELDTVQKLPAMPELPVLDTGAREAGQEVSDGVRAVTRNARRAFDFLAREIPMPEIESN